MSRPAGFHHSAETKEKIATALRGVKLSAAHCRAISLSHKGKPSPNKGRRGWFYHTEETKRKIGDAARNNQYCKGYHQTAEHRKKISEANLGKRHSDKTKEKIRQARLGVPRPELIGSKNPMHQHPNAYKSVFGKTGFRDDLQLFVKSRWEANMLRIFRFLGLNVQYEPQSFYLSDGSTYRPDFYIHETGELIEVKGRWIGGAAKRFRMFKREYPMLPISVIGPRTYAQYFDEFSGLLYLEA